MYEVILQPDERDYSNRYFWQVFCGGHPFSVAQYANSRAGAQAGAFDFVLLLIDGRQEVAYQEIEPAHCQDHRQEPRRRQRMTQGTYHVDGDYGITGGRRYG